ncbi:hypothetical protein [Microbacterium lacus]|uniref:Uncharacterized protein n=1 Tax=Microbacterium lacus TaxID=415217 RepID=A0ABN2FYG3_9MICO
MAQVSAWRVSDATAYDQMRADAARLCGLLLRVPSGDGKSADARAEELAGIRRDAVSVDGFDRRAIDALASRFRARIAELSG